MRLAAAMRLDAVVESLYGPRCVRCGKERTTNPSKTCARCLGARCCSKCRGAGSRMRDDGRMVACIGCRGTGTRRIVR